MKIQVSGLEKHIKNGEGTLDWDIRGQNRISRRNFCADPEYPGVWCCKFDRAV